MAKTQESISQQKSARSEPRKLGCAGVIFTAIGVAFLVPFVIIPVARSVSASRWSAVPCTILSSEVKIHSGSDDGGSTYSIEVTYDYVVADHAYTGTHYDFTFGSSSSYDFRRRIVDALPPGKRTVCFVNPRNPADAVLSRGIGHEMWIAIIPLVFLVIGIATWFAGRRASARLSQGYTPTLAPPVGADANAKSPTRRWAAAPTPGATRPGPVTLKPLQSPYAAVLAVLVFTVIWNGIIAVFVSQSIPGWRVGKHDLCNKLFLIPFVLVGLGAIVLTIYQILQLFNPRPQISIGRDPIAPGETTEVRWSFSGRYDRISRLTLHLEGREEATYRRGTTTTTDKSVFARVELMDTTRAAEVASGRQQMTVPAGSVYTFASASNRIIWSLHVQGDIAGWPDVKTDFPVTVQPPINAKATPALVAPADASTSADAQAVATETENPVGVELDGTHSAFAPGDTIQGTAKWRFDAPLQSVDVRLFWYTSGKGTRDVGVIQTTPVSTPAQVGSYHFSFQLPLTPISFSGRLISVIWAIEVLAKPRHGSLQTARVEFVSSPTRREFVLGVVPQLTPKGASA